MSDEILPQNIALIYGYEPSGHHIAACAVAQHLPREIVKPHLISVSDIFPKTSKFIVKTYLEILQKTPILWNYLYDNPLITKTYSSLNFKIPKYYTERIKKILHKNNISFTLSTHAFSSIMTDEITFIHKRFALITDIFPHSFWPKNMDIYFAPTQQTYNSLTSSGINPKNIIITGMPLRKEFYIKYNPEKLKRKMKINKNPTFLITGGTKGIGDIINIIKIFSEIPFKLNLIVFCGSNNTLRKKIKNMKFPNLKLYPLKYQPNPAVYYAVSDCIIGKSGGITIFETAAFKKPFIVYSPLPGQEEKNADYLLSHHLAPYPKNLRELKEIIVNFLNNRNLMKKYAENISKLHKSNASVEISSKIIKSLY